jgi:hypothetical protein
VRGVGPAQVVVAPEQGAERTVEAIGFRLARRQIISHDLFTRLTVFCGSNRATPRAAPPSAGIRSSLYPINNINIVKMHAVDEKLEKLLLNKRLLVSEQELELDPGQIDARVALQRADDVHDPTLSQGGSFAAVAGEGL